MKSIPEPPRPRIHDARRALRYAGLAALLLAAVSAPLVASADASALHVTWRPAIASPRAASPPDAQQAALLTLCGPADGALMEVAAQTAKRQLEGASALTADELAFSLRASGDPHVWPKAWSLAGMGLDDEGIGTRFKSWLKGFPAIGKRRCGVARMTSPEGKSVSTVIMVDALADIASIPTSARVGQWISLEGTMLVPASAVKVVLLGPRAAPRTVPSTLSEGRIRSTFAVDQPGPWLVQVLATVSTGPRPVLEAMIFAGQKPPQAFARAPVPGEEAFAGAKDDADAVLRMVNAARVAEGVSPLVRDPALDKLAQAHSDEMLKTRLVGHDVGTGDPRARIAAAGIAARLAGENVASASSLQNAHRALWASPSHRGNLLLDSFTRVGVAVTRGDDGSFWVTEMFVG
jgi:uncharacterized protein YkwD